MRIRSLAYQTDFQFLAFEGRILDRGDYLVAESPENPTFFWGNLLLMREPPRTGDRDDWIALFEQEFKHQPLVQHITFGWDSPEGDEGAAKEFLELGFEIEHGEILTARTDEIVDPPKLHADCEIRALRTDQEWAAVVDNQVFSRRAEFKEEMYRPYCIRQMAKYRRMSEAGLGEWYGAFVGDEIAADCGLFIFDGIGRYQRVGTQERFRRQGLCGTLIAHTARAAFKLGARQLVMAADPYYHAARIYRSVGLRPTEKQIGVYRYPKAEWSSSPARPVTS